MLAALIKAFAQLPDPRFRGVIWRALAVSGALFAGLYGLIWWGLEATRLFGWSWLESVTDMLGLWLALAVAVVLFPGAVMIVLVFMLEGIARAVETRHYPDLPAPRRQPMIEAAVSGLALAGRVVLFNLLALPAYLILFWLPPLNLFVFYGLNGYLLGREYFELMAFRRLDGAATRDMWRASRGTLWLAGVIVALLLSIPLVNWLMPVVAAAFILHVFEGLRRGAGNGRSEHGRG